MKPLLPRPPLESLAPIKDRWSPLYLEHGRVEVDDSSIKWIGADGLVCRIPAATLSVLLLGPGTTTTHAAVKACADSNLPVCWVGADGVRFYAAGVATTHDNSNARRQSEYSSHRTKRHAVARRMFSFRFGEDALGHSHTLNELRGLEGLRVRALYEQLGTAFGVSWKGRNYDRNRWDLADEINRAVSTANAALYSLMLGVIVSLGYLPQLGFVHEAGNIPFACDLADLVKAETSLPAAFEVIGQDPKADGDAVRRALKRKLEEHQVLPRMPTIIEDLFRDL